MNKDEAKTTIEEAAKKLLKDFKHAASWADAQQLYLKKAEEAKTPPSAAFFRGIAHFVVEFHKWSDEERAKGTTPEDWLVSLPKVWAALTMHALSEVSATNGDKYKGMIALIPLFQDAAMDVLILEANIDDIFGKKKKEEETTFADLGGTSFDQLPKEKGNGSNGSDA